VLKERVGTRGRKTVDVALRRVEEGHDGIEVTVGARAALPAAQRQSCPSVGDSKGVPDRPQHRLGGHAGGPGTHSVDVDRARGGEPLRDRE
jgi:hypothetical protein